MKKLAIAAAIGLLSVSAHADPGDLLVRVRAIDVNPQASWSNSGAVNGLSVDAKDAWAPELDFTYMFTNNIGAELILATTRHKVTTNLFGDVGKTSVLPPTLNVQWHFQPQAQIRPYVGVGVNYTRFYSVGLNVPGVTGLNVKKDSVGPDLQVGVDIAINKTWFVNLDLKKIYIKTDVYATDLGNARLGQLKLDPVVAGIGIGTKF